MKLSLSSSRISFVVSTIRAQWSPGTYGEPLPFGAQQPMWFLRISNTRLADSIMDLCGVPAKDSARKACLRIFTQFMAPSPSEVTNFVRQGRKRSNSTTTFREATKKEILFGKLKEVVEDDSLPSPAAERLRLLISNGCLPLSPDINLALDALQGAVSTLRQNQENTKIDPKRLKRFDDVARSIRSMRNLVQSIKAVGISPLIDAVEVTGTPGRINRPIYVSLDLGLRQRRRHYHGQLVFQCISIPNNFFDFAQGDVSAGETNETILSPSVGCFKIAEGGRYDDLVSRE